MSLSRNQRIVMVTVVIPFLLPLAHPLLIPWMGVPSHLLWWAHVLPVAVASYHLGRRGALAGIVVSAVTVALGERLFGSGYGVPATWLTAVTLTTGVSATHVLVAGFALYARSATRRYRTLFSVARSGLLHLDRHGHVIAANPAALELLGVSWATLHRRTLTTVPGLNLLPDIDTLERSPWSGAVCTDAEGAQHHLHLSVLAFPDGDSGGHQVFLVDRTTEVAQEKEIERQGRLSTLGEALAGVAHEIKNPLTVILSYAELGADSPDLPEQAREDLVLIREQAQRIRDMVQELLGFSRTRADSGSFEVVELIRRVLVVQRMAHGSAVRFSAEVTWEGRAAGSAAKAEQILTNLLANAADAVERGRGEVTTRVEVDDLGRVRITVRDDGPGVPPDLTERIFEPFLTTKKEGEGTGLGLAISRKLAETMGGSLELDPTPNPGATFVLTLRPALVPDDSATQTPEAA